MTIVDKTLKIVKHLEICFEFQLVMDLLLAVKVLFFKVCAYVLCIKKICFYSKVKASKIKFSANKVKRK
jgi:hypothetical protein